jgi:hypothetical protein
LLAREKAMTPPYNETVEKAMQDYFETLSEKDRRRYAGVEALKLGHGGVGYIAALFGTSRTTVRKGQKEISEMPAAEKTNKRIRKKGAVGADTTRSMQT